MEVEFVSFSVKRDPTILLVLNEDDGANRIQPRQRKKSGHAVSLVIPHLLPEPSFLVVSIVFAKTVQLR